MNILTFAEMSAILGLDEATIRSLKKSFATEEELTCMAWCAANNTIIDLDESAAAFKDAALEKGFIYVASKKERAVRRLEALVKWTDCGAAFNPYLFCYNKENKFIEGSFAAISPISDEHCDEIFAYLKEVLTAREYQIISQRSGFDGEPQTLKSIAKSIGATHERVRQTEARAGRKLYCKLRRSIAWKRFLTSQAIA